MRLRKNFCTKKIWPVSDLDPDPKSDPDPNLTLGRIRIRNRIRNFCFGSATLLILPTLFLKPPSVLAVNTTAIHIRIWAALMLTELRGVGAAWFFSKK
jgi:hypothetical protein